MIWAIPKLSRWPSALTSQDRSVLGSEMSRLLPAQVRMRTLWSFSSLRTGKSPCDVRTKWAIFRCLELQIKRSNHTLNPRVVAIMEPMDTTLYLDKVSCFKTNTACSALVPVITSAWPARFLQTSLPKYDALIAIIGIQRWILVEYGGFLKWGVSSIYRWVFRSKRSSIFGVPPFQETPICFCL